MLQEKLIVDGGSEASIDFIGEAVNFSPRDEEVATKKFMLLVAALACLIVAATVLAALHSTSIW